ncbi:MAG: hypothetical protein KKB21_00905 [Nanoarchaeota archaeon]|nr:hypothetical protein [Nanoarchaeota archaeon]MBU4086115.1 hypothetical protein [Nanoarchaeota archaeon]
MNHKEKYQNIINELISKSFPELKNEKIKVMEFPNIFPLAESFSTKSFRNYYIFINKKCTKRNLSALKGQLVHELCHIILDYTNKGFCSSFWHLNKKNLSVAFNTKFSRKIENKTDRETIKRGYAKQRYRLALDWEKIFKKKLLNNSLYPRGYLTPEQIKSYAKKSRKW